MPGSDSRRASRWAGQYLGRRLRQRLSPARNWRALSEGRALRVGLEGSQKADSGRIYPGLGGRDSICRQGVRRGDLHPYTGTLPAPGKNRARAQAGRAKRADYRRAEATALLLYRGRARAVLLLSRAVDYRGGTATP